MKLNREAIVSVLDRLGVEFEQTPEAFELKNGWCLRAGSGIAGKGEEWFLWHAKGTASGEKRGGAKNKKQLRALLVDGHLDRHSASCMCFRCMDVRRAATGKSMPKTP